MTTPARVTKWVPLRDRGCARESRAGLPGRGPDQDDDPGGRGRRGGGRRARALPGGPRRARPGRRRRGCTAGRAGRPRRTGAAAMTMGRNAFDADTDADAGAGASTDGFARSRDRFETLLEWLDGEEAGGLSHGELETRLSVDHRELFRPPPGGPDPAGPRPETPRVGGPPIRPATVGGSDGVFILKPRREQHAHTAEKGFPTMTSTDTFTDRTPTGPAPNPIPVTGRPRDDPLPGLPTVLHPGRAPAVLQHRLPQDRVPPPAPATRPGGHRPGRPPPPGDHRLRMAPTAANDNWASNAARVAAPSPAGSASAAPAQIVTGPWRFPTC